MYIGTLEERGIAHWRKLTEDSSQKDDVTGKPDNKLATYDFPFGMSFIRKWRWTRYVPICPTFRVSNLSCHRCCGSRKRKGSAHDEEEPT